MKIIRKANLNDFEAIYKIVRASSDWMKREYGFIHWDEYYSKEQVKKNFTKGTVYTLDINNQPVATYTVSTKNPYYYSFTDLNNFADPKAKAYYLTTLCVSPNEHGKGYAKQLLNHLISLVKEKKVKYIRFDVKGDYKELITFYEKLDFKIVGEMDDEGEIYYLFEKKI